MAFVEQSLTKGSLQRFSLLLLEPGEIYFDDYSVWYFPECPTEDESMERHVGSSPDPFAMARSVRIRRSLGSPHDSFALSTILCPFPSAFAHLYETQDFASAGPETH